MCWLIRRKGRVQIPDPISQRKYENISSEASSQQISESKYNCHEKLIKNLSFGVDLNCRSRCEKLNRNADRRVVMANYVTYLYKLLTGFIFSCKIRELKSKMVE